MTPPDRALDLSAGRHAALEALSTLPLKRWLFAFDPFFRECWAELVARWGGDLTDHVSRSSFLVVTPDGIVARRIHAIIAYLAEAGFVPIGATLFRFNPWSIRELYRYSLHGATAGRFHAMDLLFMASPSLLVLLRDARERANESAATRLSTLKGSWLVAHRQPHQLRARIEAGNGLLSFLHAPDETADVIRELGVLLSAESRVGLIGDFGGAGIRLHDLAPFEAHLYAITNAHDLDLDNSLQRIERACGTTCRRPDASAIATLCAQARIGHIPDWAAARRRARDIGLRIDDWDWIVVGSACALRAERSEPGLFDLATGPACEPPMGGGAP